MTMTKYGNWERHVALRCLFGSEGKKLARSNGTLGGSVRRWVVERTHRWINRFRSVLIRCEKRVKTKTLSLCSIWPVLLLRTGLRVSWERFFCPRDAQRDYSKQAA